MAVKEGPLTRADLEAIWEGAIDRAYREPLVAAGEGNGLETQAQSWEILARTSRAVDITTQAMFIMPWSGQTDEPAAGESKATVTLTFARTKRLEVPLVLAAGYIFAEEQTTDWGENGGEVVLTDRRYILTDTLVFHPGDMGPFTVTAEAEVAGYGHNNPMPGAIQVVSQVGENLQNELASVALVGPAALSAPTEASVTVTAANEADMFVPEHVGQYVAFTDGANAGRIGRVASFVAPSTGIGSGVLLELEQSIEASVYAGTFQAGELLSLANGGPAFATARCLGERIVSGTKKLTWVALRGDFTLIAVTTTTVTGLTSGATLTIAFKTFPQLFSAESSAATWRVYDWAADFGLTVTNVDSPTGGKSGWLDEIADERMLARGSGEDDETFRPRVWAVSDTVAPNALKRALSRTLGALSWCFREVGMSELPGFFYDGSNVAVGTATTTTIADKLDAYDTDVGIFTGVLTSGVFIFNEKLEVRSAAGTIAHGYFGRIDGGVTFTFIRKDGTLTTGALVATTIVGMTSGAIFTPASVSVPASVNARRFHRYFDYTEFRGFFLVGLQRLGIGEYGIAYDSGTHDAYDEPSLLNFFDGSPLGAGALYKRVYDAMLATKAGGVGFDLYLEDWGCP